VLSVATISQGKKNIFAARGRGKGPSECHSYRKSRIEQSKAAKARGKEMRGLRKGAGSPSGEKTPQEKGGFLFANPKEHPQAQPQRQMAERREGRMRFSTPFSTERTYLEKERELGHYNIIDDGEEAATVQYRKKAPTYWAS